MKMWMRLMCMILVVILLFSGCGGVSGKKGTNKKENKTLTICVDVELEPMVDIAVDIFKKIHKNVFVVLEVIPADSAAAEAKVTKLRTQTLAGEGPDVFVMSCPDYKYLEKKVSLFANPEITIRSDVFLPLDDYIANATYMDVTKWNTTMMDAGKTEDGQMVIPITYTYYGYVQDGKAFDDESVPTSWDTFSAWENKDVKTQTQSWMPMTFPYLFGDLCDYDARTVLYSEDEVYDVLNSVNTYMNVGRFEGMEEGSVISGKSDLSLLKCFAGKENTAYFTLPNVEGKTTAFITSYAAVNANTKDPDLAFSFMDVLCSDEWMGGLGFEFEGNDFMFAGGWTSIWMMYGLPVYEHGFVAELKYLSDEEVEMYRSVANGLDSVRFMSHMDWELIQIFNLTFIRGWKETLDEEECRKQIREVLNSWELQLKE